MSKEAVAATVAARKDSGPQVDWRPTMAEPVIYIRGFPGDRTEVLSEEMLRDLATVVSLEDTTVASVISALSEQTGFLDVRGLTDIISSHLSDDAAGAVRRILINLEAGEVPKLLDSLRRLNEERGDDVPEPLRQTDRLGDVLTRLVVPIPSLRRFRKAERLARVTGLPLDEVQIICDLRPVFNDARDQVEGLFPYTRLRLSATGGDGLPRVFEAELSAEHVRDLAEKAGKALEKLSTLQQCCGEWAQFELPEMPLTRMKPGGDANA